MHKLQKLNSLQQTKINLFLFMISGCLFTAGSAYTQHLNVGLKAGINRYSIHTGVNDSYKSISGFHSGFTAQIRMTKQWSLVPELLYSKQGTSFKKESLLTQLQLDYIQLPVLLEHRFSNGLGLQAGPFTGFLVDAHSETQNIKTEVKHLFRKMEMGMSTGVSYNGRKTGLGADIRFNLSLSNIYKNNPLPWRNLGFQAGLFYRFTK